MTLRLSMLPGNGSFVQLSRVQSSRGYYPLTTDSTGVFPSSMEHIR